MENQNPTNPAENIEKLVRDYQLLQEQMRAYAMQLEQLQIQKNEFSTAKEEVSKASGKVYVTVGGVIVETSKEIALKNIGEKSETTEIRLQSTNKQYTELKAKEKQLRDKISQFSSTQQ